MSRPTLPSRPRILWPVTAFLCAVATLIALVVPGVAIPSAAAASSVTFEAAADATATQVSQDGNGNTTAQSTLATCPQLCDGNAQGRRDAVVEFAVTGLPAGARVTGATLRLYSWSAYPATSTVRATTSGARSTVRPETLSGTVLNTRSSVVAGFNDYSVTAAVTGNGTYTFAVAQTSHDTRVYWASKENTGAGVHPRLAITYDTAPLPGWQLSWADEFDDSTIASADWNIRVEGRSVDKGCNVASPDNLFENDGHLTIRVLRKQARCAGEDRQYTEGYLDTIGKHSWQYGKFEVRAMSPTGSGVSKGLWPAFWLRPDDSGIGEIDVVELPGGNQYYDKATFGLFRDYTPTKLDTRKALPDGALPADGYHVYTTEWEPGVLRWYVDGHLLWTVTAAQAAWLPEAFDRGMKFNLRLNVQTGGWLGDPDSTTVFPADFLVDYVRVYQRLEGSRSTSNEAPGGRA